MQQKASDIVVEYLSEPEYRERFAEQVIKSVDTGCYEDGVFFETPNYESYWFTGIINGFDEQPQYDEYYREKLS